MPEEPDKPSIKPHATPEQASTSSFVTEVKHVPLAEVHESEENARRHFDPAGLKDLAADIGRNKLINPLSVRAVDRGYELIAGARRYRACKLLDLDTVEVKVFDVDEFQARLVGLSENLSREDLNPYDEAIGILDYFTLVFSRTAKWDELVEEHGSPINATANLLRRFGLRHPEADVKASFDLGMTGDEALEVLGAVFGERIGMNVRTFGKNRLRLLALHQNVQDALRGGLIEYSSALVLQRVDDDELRAQYIQITIDESLTVNEVDNLVKHGPNKAELKAERSANEVAIQSVRRNFRFFGRLPAGKQKRAAKLTADLAELLEEARQLKK